MCVARGITLVILVCSTVAVLFYFFNNMLGTQHWPAVQVSHGAIQFMVYEELKALTAGAGEYAKDTGRSSLSAGQISVIGAVSKLAASVVTYPSQVQPC